MSGETKESAEKKQPVLGYEDYKKTVRENPADAVDQSIETATDTVSSANEAELLSTGPDAFRRIEEQIKNAKKSIHINIFSWAADSSGTRISQMLTEAKQRNQNLDIQIRADKLGCMLVGSKDELKRQFTGIFTAASLLMQLSRDYPHLNVAKLMSLSENPNNIYEFSPDEKNELNDFLQKVLTEEMLFKINPALKGMKDAGINILVENNPLANMDHSKVFVFDDQTAMSGGMNVGDDYSGGYEEGKGWTGKVKPDYWKDYMVQSKGPVSSINRHNFFGVEQMVNDKLPASVNNTNMRGLHNRGGETPPNSPNFAKEKQITFATNYLLDHAQKEIVVEHAYIMDQGIVDRLKTAAGRGVKVTIIRSQPESQGLENANEQFFKQLNNVTNISVLRFPRVSHTKLMSVDGKYSIIGSANLSTASLAYNEETSYMVSGDSPLQRQIQAQLQAAVTLARSRQAAARNTRAGLDALKGEAAA